MRLTHKVIITVYVKEFDDEEETANTLISFLPENFEEEKIKIDEEKVKIDEKTEMSIFRVKTEKERHNKHIIAKLKDILPTEALEKSIKTIDDEGYIYIRLDRKALEKDGTAKLVEHGDCYHFKILLAAYPKTKEKAIEVGKKLFLN